MRYGSEHKMRVRLECSIRQGIVWRVGNRGASRIAIDSVRDTYLGVFQISHVAIGTWKQAKECMHGQVRKSKRIIGAISKFV